jgi:N6-adenosine-specific RNA methylase IME4/ParB-like chromosome segregation protein Spo0J
MGDVVEFHPYAEIFPLIEGAEFEALVADIKQHGLTNPITLYEEKILDGRNRYLACRAADVDPFYDDYEGEDPLAFVLSQNVKRRHLDASQRSAIAARTLQACKVSQPKAAELLSVSPRSVASALKVMETADPAVFDAVMAGKVAVSRAVEIADLPADDQRELVTNMAPADIITTHERWKKERKREETFKRIREQAESAPEWPTGRYSVIYADPPTEDDYGHTKRDTEHHYPTMTWDEVKDLAVDMVTTEDAVCYLWATPHTIHKSLEVLAAWGFSYRSHAVWVKDRIGLGAWFRNQHELLLVGRKGEFPPPEESLRASSVHHLPAGDHSAKPEAFAEMIERWYPDAVKLELFRRGPPRPGWVAWGFETAMVAA